MRRWWPRRTAPSLEELRTAPPAWILDLHGRLGADIERLPGYEGIGWAV